MTTHYRVDPVDFEQTKEELGAFLKKYVDSYKAIDGVEYEMLVTAYQYLDILSTKNWSINED